MKLFTALLLLSGLHAVFTCECEPDPGHPQVQYCTNDAVFIGRLKKVVKNPNARFIRYRFRVKQVLKGSVSGRITVSSRDSSCGVTDLEERKRYLLTVSRNVNGRYFISKCTSLVIEQSNITKKVIRLYDSNMPNSYPGKDEINCKTCQIEYCGLNPCATAPPPTTCTYFGDQTKIDCYNTLQCVPLPSGDSCRWSSKKC